jgi:predicted component of type VI protein secretion system
MADLLGTKTETEAAVPVEQIPVEAPEVVEVGEAGEVKEVGEVGEAAAPETVPAAPPEAAPPPAPVEPTPPAPEVDRLAKQIEEIMAEDMTEVFLKLPPDQQQTFKAKGEETASAIRELVASAKEVAKKVFDLIKKWLQMIPGVNKFYLEQEAKLKTDKILRVAEEEKQRRPE